MDSKGQCDECQSAEKGGSTPKAAKTIGQNVILGQSVGRGYDQTEYEFFQCPTCGSVWTTYADSGAGGHGRFSRRLTKGLF
jgi:hypothetical protein